MTRRIKQTEIFRGFGEVAVLRSDRTLVIGWPGFGPLPDGPRTVALQRLAMDLRWNRKGTRAKYRGMGWIEAGAGIVMLPLPEQADPLLTAMAVLSGRAEWLDQLLVEWTALLPPIEDYRRGEDIVCRTSDGQAVRVWSSPKRGPIHLERRVGGALEVRRYADMAALADGSDARPARQAEVAQA